MDKLLNDCDIPLLRPTHVRTDFAIAEARKLRKLLDLQKPWVNIDQVIRSQGIILHYNFDLERPTTCRVDYGKCIMLIPPAFNEAVSRWDRCHEFAHIHLRHYEDYPLDRIFRGVYISLLTNREKYILEREAHIFTSEFLMAKDWVFKLLRYPITWDTVDKMRRKFEVSKEAMVYRLDDLKLIKKVEFAKTGICLPPPTMPGDRPLKIYKGAL